MNNLATRLEALVPACLILGVGGALASATMPGGWIQFGVIVYGFCCVFTGFSLMCISSLIMNRKKVKNKKD